MLLSVPQSDVRVVNLRGCNAVLHVVLLRLSPTRTHAHAFPFFHRHHTIVVNHATLPKTRRAREWRSTPREIDITNLESTRR